ncbi:hypothetical protein Lal_00019251 [Lupinus albus]|nr:hypothetical protein Lal_00019251 [Lupinus albus]
MASSNGGVPPGFRFHPTDEELLHYYLKKKVSFQKFDMDVIREVDLNKMEPWDLQERCKIGSTPQNEWYFFSHKDKKYPTGSRTNRATNAGFWKATGRDKCIRNTYKKIGMRKTLVFYKGRAPHGQKSDWIMHEYRLEDSNDPQSNNNEEGWVVCRVFKKKNLFKVGNEGASTQQLNNNNYSSSDTNARSSMLRDNHYLLHQQNLRNPSDLGSELHKPELGLHYPHLQQNPHYPLFQSQQSLLQTHKPMAYDYSSYASGSGMYQVSEGGMEVGSCEGEEMGGGRSGEGMNEWGVLDRLVTSHLGANANANEDSSKGVRFEDAPNPHHHLSLRGEIMDFWGYSKQ